MAELRWHGEPTGCDLSSFVMAEVRPCLGTIDIGDTVCFVGAERRHRYAGTAWFTVERWTDASAHPPLGVALTPASPLGFVALRRP